MESLDGHPGERAALPSHQTAGEVEAETAGGNDDPDRLRQQPGIAPRLGREPADLFQRSIALEGPLDAEQRMRLMEIANRCPVHRTLESGSAIETSEIPVSEAPTANVPSRDASRVS